MDSLHGNNCKSIFIRCQIGTARKKYLIHHSSASPSSHHLLIGLNLFYFQYVKVRSSFQSRSSVQFTSNMNVKWNQPKTTRTKQKKAHSATARLELLSVIWCGQTDRFHPRFRSFYPKRKQYISMSNNTKAKISIFLWLSPIIIIIIRQKHKTSFKTKS